MLRALVYLITLTFLPLFTYAQCWNLVWEDDFTGTSLNMANWSYNTGSGGWGNSELQYYTDRTENVSVSGGTLKITARAESYLGSNYTSGRIVTKNKAFFTFGKFTARIKLPIGQGIWPAFWMLPDENYYGGWPYSGELDIMELIGNLPSRSYGTIHATNNGSHVYTGGNYNLASGTFADDFHEFTMEWDPSEVRHYVDGVLYLTLTNAQLGANPWPFDRAFHFLLNVAVGGSWPGNPDASTIFPKTMEVDYVRVYQKLENMVVSGQELVEPYVSGKNYSVPNVAGSSYTWTVPTGASIVSGQGTNSIQVNWGNTGGNITAQVNNACGTSSRSLAVTVSPNIWSNPSFENDLSQWTFKRGGTAAGTAAISTTDVQQGSKSAQIAITNAGSNPWDAQLSRMAVGVVPGQAYSLSLWVKSDVNRLASLAFIHPTNYTYYAGKTFTATPTWQQITLDFTAPAGQIQLLFNLDLARFAGATYTFDNFSLAQSALLPLELLYFQGKREGGNVVLEWTAIDHQIESYEIQRAENDPLNFKTIASVPAKGGLSAIKYSYVDRNTTASDLYYRLLSIESSGAQDQSSIIKVENKVVPFVLSPNPTSNSFRIHTDKEVFFLEIYDENGRIIKEKKEQVTINEYSLSAYPQGFYFVKIWAEEGANPVTIRVRKE